MRRKNRVSLLVSKEPEFDDKELATYSCGDCGNYTSVQASLKEPFCVSCGGEDLDKIDDDETELDFESEEDLVSAKCVDCKQYNIFTQETYSNLNEDGVVTIHCPVCSKENKWQDTGTENIFVASSKEGRVLCKKFDDTELAHITCDSCNEDSIMTMEYAKTHSTSSGIGTVQCPACLENIVFQEETFAEDSEDFDDADGDESDDDDDEGRKIEDLDDDDSGDDDKDADIEDTGDANVQNVDLVKSSNNNLYAIADDSIIAKLSVADKTDSEVDALSKALILAFKESDATDVLIDNGFGIIDASNNDFINVSDIKAQMNDDLDKHKEVLYQSIGIAACGINRKVFQEDNPLQVSLVKNLSAHMSEEDAEAIVSNAFAESADDYVEMLREQTKEIANKSDEVRNELSKTIMGMSIPVVSKTITSNVEKRLLQPVEGYNSPVNASKYKGNSKVISIARKNGGRPLFAHAGR